jgi:hypothetical protein
MIVRVLAGLAALVGLVVFVSAKSAIHEIESFVLFLIAAVLFSGAEIVLAISRATSQLRGVVREAVAAVRVASGADQGQESAEAQPPVARQLGHWAGEIATECVKQNETPAGRI